MIAGFPDSNKRLHAVRGKLMPRPADRAVMVIAILMIGICNGVSVGRRQGGAVAPAGGAGSATRPVAKALSRSGLTRLVMMILPSMVIAAKETVNGRRPAALSRVTTPPPRHRR